MSTNEQCITSATQYYLFSQYCESILFVLTEYSYLIFTLCEPSCNGGTPLHSRHRFRSHLNGYSLATAFRSIYLPSVLFSTTSDLTPDLGSSWSRLLQGSRTGRTQRASNITKYTDRSNFRMFLVIT